MLYGNRDRGLGFAYYSPGLFSGNALAKSCKADNECGEFEYCINGRCKEAKIPPIRWPYGFAGDGVPTPASPNGMGQVVVVPQAQTGGFLWPLILLGGGIWAVSAILGSKPRRASRRF